MTSNYYPPTTHQGSVNTIFNTSDYQSATAKSSDVNTASYAKINTTNTFTSTQTVQGNLATNNVEQKYTAVGSTLFTTGTNAISHIQIGNIAFNNTIVLKNLVYLNQHKYASLTAGVTLTFPTCQYLSYDSNGAYAITLPLLTSEAQCGIMLYIKNFSASTLTLTAQGTNLIWGINATSGATTQATILTTGVNITLDSLWNTTSNLYSWVRFS